MIMIGNLRVIKGGNLGYDMMCESINSDQEEKEGDVLNGNHIINLKNLISNIDTFLVCKECAQERELEIKLEEERDVENFFDYVEAYFQLTSPDEQKVARDFMKTSRNKDITVKQPLIRIHYACPSPSTAMV